MSSQKDSVINTKEINKITHRTELNGNVFIVIPIISNNHSTSEHPPIQYKGALNVPNQSEVFTQELLQVLNNSSIMNGSFLEKHQSPPSANFTLQESGWAASFSPNSGIIFGINQLSPTEVDLLGQEITYTLNLDSKNIKTTKTPLTGVVDYLYSQQNNFQIFVAGYDRKYGAAQLLVIQNSQVVFLSKKCIAWYVTAENDITGDLYNFLLDRSVWLYGSRVYWLAHSSRKLLMFDLDELKNDPGYQAVVINADSNFSDIALDDITLTCLNNEGEVSRIDCYYHYVIQRKKLSVDVDKKRVYFTIAVKEPVVMVASCKSMQNTVELLDYRSLEIKDSFLIPKPNKNGFAVMKMKIFKKMQQSFIVWTTQWYHMYLLWCYNNKILLMDQKENFWPGSIHYFDQLIRSQKREDVIQLIVTGKDLHHIVTIKINN